MDWAKVGNCFVLMVKQNTWNIPKILSYSALNEMMFGILIKMTRVGLKKSNINGNDKRELVFS